jgi:putative signal transducing protein
MSDSSLVPAFGAKDFIEAQIVRGLLVSEGIQAFIPGESLNDEFGMSARLAGTVGTTVLVPSTQLAKAQAIIAAYQSQEEDDRVD